MEAPALPRITEDPIHLLVSDVVMPMVSEREFAQEMLQLRRARPVYEAMYPSPGNP